VKALVAGAEEERRFKSPKRMSAELMVEKVLALTDGWSYDVVSVGVPAQVRAGRVVHEPVNLGRGWVGFDYQEALGRPTIVVNDAAMQALGSYDGGRMLYLGLGTGLGSAMVVDGMVEPMELGHLPYRKKTYEDYVGERGLERLGLKRWRKAVADVVGFFVAALDPDYVVLGGGNVDKLAELPPRSRRGDNMNAFVGGFRLWDERFEQPTPLVGEPAAAPSGSPSHETP
jgi:predicted NBD/HSP70 family sugar kinase